jgi:hypothetical protein
MFLKFSKCAFA